MPNVTNKHRRALLPLASSAFELQGQSQQSPESSHRGDNGIQAAADSGQDRAQQGGLRLGALVKQAGLHGSTGPCADGVPGRQHILAPLHEGVVDACRRSVLPSGGAVQVHMAYKIKAMAQPWQAEMKADHVLCMHALLVAARCSLCC